MQSQYRALHLVHRAVKIEFAHCQNKLPASAMAAPCLQCCEHGPWYYYYYYY